MLLRSPNLERGCERGPEREMHFPVCGEQQPGLWGELGVEFVDALIRPGATWYMRGGGEKIFGREAWLAWEVGDGREGRFSISIRCILLISEDRFAEWTQNVITKECCIGPPKLILKHLENCPKQRKFHNAIFSILVWRKDFFNIAVRQSISN